MTEVLGFAGDRKAAPQHPIDVLKGEHELLLSLAAELKSAVHEASVATDPARAAAAQERVRGMVRRLKESENHYVREENVLFPYLEKHGVVQPPAAMWSEHNEIRAIKKRLYSVLDPAWSAGSQSEAAELVGVARELEEMLASHFYKENNILFPAALKLFTEQEWESSREQFEEVGYWEVRPAPVTNSKRAESGTASNGAVVFETGTLSPAVVESILDTLPVDITFVDDNDTVRYFNQTRDRIFPRLKAVIGRKVQQCHPQTSVHLVQQILEEFRAGRKENAEFWIQSGGHFIHIRFFAVRDRAGKYLGCMEVTQDATRIRQLEGEKRLL